MTNCLKDFDLELFRLFDELDGIIIDCMPDSLEITPAALIRQICREKFGVILTRQEIVQAYTRYQSELGGGEYVE